MLTNPARVVVLLEGVSDVSAVRALAAVEGVDLAGVELLELGGVTNFGRALRSLQRDAPQATVLGLCDAGEAPVVQRALARVGRPATPDLAAAGFFVCHADLEDELIRALGPERAVAAVEAAGLGNKFALFTAQVAWRGRPVAEQLRRFCGVASGRKEYLAGQLAGSLGRGEAPPPLRSLLDHLRR